MTVYKHFQIVAHNFIKHYSTRTRPKVIPDEDMLKNIANNVYKPKHHPGILKPNTVELPIPLIKAIENVTEDCPVKTLVENSDGLVRHLKGKRAPLEKTELKEKSQEVYQRVSSKHANFVISNENDKLRYKQKIKNHMDDIFRKEVYNWKPVDYNEHNSLVYLIGRVAPEYAVLVKIFAEISARDPEFRPNSLFDFGSGVGTVTWAANMYWKKSIFEYFNVDSSADMNDLAQTLLQGGRGSKQISLKGVFYRQFLPALNVMYDLVVSAYSLLELPSRQARLETILNLWNKTQNYLVVVEQGTNAGFKVINEVRDFILHTKNTRTVGHVFSPCPHDNVCPRFVSNDETPCNFQVNYFSLPVGAISKPSRERFCYIVIKKGERDSSDPQWPRVVRETLVRPRHTICRICTKRAELEEVIFTSSKHGKTMYHCARSTRWGDLLPIKLEARNEEGDPEKSECRSDSDT